MAIEKTTLNYTEKKALDYLSDGKEATTHEIGNIITPGSNSVSMSFLVSNKLVESSKYTSEKGNILVTKYKITDLGLKALQNIQNGIIQEFDSWRHKAKTEWNGRIR